MNNENLIQSLPVSDMPQKTQDLNKNKKKIFIIAILILAAIIGFKLVVNYQFPNFSVKSIYYGFKKLDNSNYLIDKTSDSVRVVFTHPKYHIFMNCAKFDSNKEAEKAYEYFSESYYKDTPDTKISTYNKWGKKYILYYEDFFPNYRTNKMVFYALNGPYILSVESNAAMRNIFYEMLDNCGFNTDKIYNNWTNR